MGKPEKLVDDLSKKSFADLAELRIKTGDLKTFNGWLPSRDMYPNK
jgi:hypothetical protein